MKSGEATVVKNAGSHYLLSELPAWELFSAVLRGKVRLKASEITNPVAVGDKVRYEWAGDTLGPAGPGMTETPGQTAVITEILPRRNYVIRRSTNLSRQAHIIAANVDRAYIVVSLFFPEIKLPFLDRILVTCELYGIPATIVLSKTDMYREMAADEIAHFRSIYEGAGYPVIETSVKTGEGIAEIREACQGRVNLFSGESGVGKSSLIKALDPSLDPKIGAISAAHLQGKHTTSLYEMYPLASGGYVIDSPGIRGFGLVDVEKEEIAKYFPEMLRASADCRFTPCTHTHEPGCAVKAAVDEGLISPERYNSYLGMLEEDKKFR
jgi:ribosome biogenesis GTPase